MEIFNKTLKHTRNTDHTIIYLKIIMDMSLIKSNYYLSALTACSKHQIVAMEDL